MNREQQVAALKKDWAENPRWKGVHRPYTAEDVVRLRGSLKIEYTLATRGAERLWRQCNELPFVNSLGALTVQVKVRYSDFTTLTRQIRLEEPVTSERELYRTACHLLARHRLVTAPLRLIGIGVSTLVPPAQKQLRLLL